MDRGKYTGDIRGENIHTGTFKVSMPLIYIYKRSNRHNFISSYKMKVDGNVPSMF